ncbi:MAG: DUF3194 domain-containing protein [Candidatus Baldrarchaeia archaeon]
MRDKRKPYDLMPEELEELCELAENIARKYVFAKVSKSDVTNFVAVVNIETKGDQLNVDVQIELDLLPFTKFNADALANEAVDEAIKAIEKRLRELTGENPSLNKFS